MSEPGPTSLLVNAFVHATEDEEKVVKAIKTILIGEVFEATRIQRKSMKGHFHNPLIRLTFLLEDPPLVCQVLQFVGSKISSGERDYLQQNLDLHYDGNRHFFLRFDKQAAAIGNLRIIQKGDSIRCTTKFSGRQFNIETLQELLNKFNLL